MVQGQSFLIFQKQKNRTKPGIGGVWQEGGSGEESAGGGDAEGCVGGEGPSAVVGGACARGAKARPGWVGLAPEARGSASPPGSEKPDSRYPARDGGAGRHWPPQTQCVPAES